MAVNFLPFLEEQAPHLVEEMKGMDVRSKRARAALQVATVLANLRPLAETGISEGCGLSFQSVLTLNTRSEIAMGMVADGCTSLAWKSDNFSVAGQNWDVSGP